MVDKPENDSASDDLTQEIARLKNELETLRDALAGRADDVVQTATRAAQAVAQPIRNNPGTAGLLMGGLVGLLVGLAIGQMERPSRSWLDRYR